MVMPYQFNNGDVEAVTFCPSYPYSLRKMNSNLIFFFKKK